MVKLTGINRDKPDRNFKEKLVKHIRRGLSITDYRQWFFIFRRGVLNQIILSMTKFKVYHLSGNSVSYVPSVKYILTSLTFLCSSAGF